MTRSPDATLSLRIDQVGPGLPADGIGTVELCQVPAFQGLWPLALATIFEPCEVTTAAKPKRVTLPFSLDGFWQSVTAYEPPVCVTCDEGVAVDEQGSCSPCHWKVQAEIDAGLPLLGSYLGKWAAFSDWESS